MEQAQGNASSTPGPWQSAHRKGADGMWNTEVFCAKGETIATIAWYPMPTVDGVTCSYRDANAHLIAAAPELLEALRAVQMDAVGTGNGENSISDAAREKVDAAIARAFGAAA